MAKTTNQRGRIDWRSAWSAGHRMAVVGCMATALIFGWVASASAQLPTARFGDVVPRDVREMYDRGLQYLAKTQTERGDWQGGQQGPGITGMGLMVFLASGEDPNFGPYSNNVRKALRNIITSQDADTGIMGNAMYHHGFAMLGLAEAYGAVDERNLWPDGKGPRSIGQALELAVRAAVTSQKKNPNGAWRYSPDAQDADTSVSGAIFVGLLAARNAGIEVSDESIDKAIAYYVSMTSTGGEVGYSGGLGGFGDSLARSSIATVVYAVARRKDLKQYRATLDYLKQRLEQTRDELSGIRALLRVPGAVPGRYPGLGEMEQAPHPPAQADPAPRWQLPGPVRQRRRDLLVAAGPGAQLPLPADL